MGLNPFQPPKRNAYAVTDPAREDVAPVPPALEPVPDTWKGTNFPYRGAETHGVDPNRTVEVSPEQWQGGTVEFVDPPADPDPVPVRIVNEGSAEIDSWDSSQGVVDGTVRQIVGRNRKRKSLQIKNLSATVVIYIGRTVSANALSGWPIDPGGDVSLSSTEDVYGVSADGSQVLVAILQEYTVS